MGDDKRDTGRPTPEPAGLFRRLGAAVYDTVLLVAVLFIATAAVLPLTGGQAIAVGTWWYKPYLLLVSYAYFAGFWVLGGQTLGMRAWKLWVRSVDGTPLSWRAAALRFVGAIVSWLVLGLGFFWVLIDKQKLAWHDRLSASRLWVEDQP